MTDVWILNSFQKMQTLQLTFNATKKTLRLTFWIKITSETCKSTRMELIHKIFNWRPFMNNSIKLGVNWWSVFNEVAPITLITKIQSAFHSANDHKWEHRVNTLNKYNNRYTRLDKWFATLIRSRFYSSYDLTIYLNLWKSRKMCMKNTTFFEISSILFLCWSKVHDCHTLNGECVDVCC